MKFIPFIFKNVFRKKTRTILTIFSIILPLMVICLLGSFLRVLYQPNSAQSRGMFRLVTRHKVGLTNPIPVSYAEKIRQLDGVVTVTKFNWFGGTYIDDSSRNFFARFAVEPETFMEVFDDAFLIDGSAADWLKDRSGCIVGKDLISKYGWRIGDQISIVGNIYPVTLQLTIRGVYDVAEGTPDALFFNRKYLEEALPGFEGIVGTIWTKAKDADAANRLGDKIDEMFENSPYPTKTETEKAFQMSFVSMLGNVKLLIGSMGVVIVLVITLIAANTIAISARERVREIAVLRTLGFSRTRILSLILGESITIALFGGSLGVGIFVLSFDPLKVFLKSTPMGGLANALFISYDIILIGFTISIFVGLFAGIVPAIAASRRSIREGLRYIG